MPRKTPWDYLPPQEQVVTILEAVRNLPKEYRSALLNYLGKQWTQSGRPWRNPRDRLPPLEVRLLDFLDGKDAVTVRNVINHLWSIAMRRPVCWPCPSPGSGRPPHAERCPVCGSAAPCGMTRVTWRPMSIGSGRRSCV
jgi:hypothetical protein